MNLFQEEAPTANELAITMGCSRQNVKEILNALEKKGMIDFQEDELDRRKKRVVLTEKATNLGEKYGKKEMIFMEKLYEGISDDEIYQTFQILARIEKNLIEIKEYGNEDSSNL